MSIEFKKHETFPELILIRDFRGVVTIADIIASWENLIENRLITPNIKGVINNLTGCELKMEIKNRTILFDYLKQKAELKNLMLAVISNNPNMIVIPTLGEIEVNEVRIKPFSTFQAAESWILKS